MNPASCMPARPVVSSEIPSSACPNAATELLTLSAANELGFYRAVGLVFRGWSLAVLEHADEGISLLATGLAGMHDAGFILYRPQNLTLLGDACRMAGQWQTALGHFAEAQRLAEATEERWFQAETLRLTGDVRLGTGDSAGAEASYGEALAIARRQSAKLWELRAATSLARLWRDQNKLSPARDLLAPVCGRFTEGLATPVLQDAKALLEELSEIGSPSGRGLAVAGADATGC